MSTQEIEATLQAFAAAGADRGLCYLSTPITTGRRELELMEKHSVSSREELRTEYAQEWRQLVLRTNEYTASQQADIFVETAAFGRVVVNPARISHTDWGQDDYDLLWTELIRRFPTTIVPLEGWAYSRGARLEVALALELRLPVLNLDGSRKDVEELARELAEAEAEIEARGWAAFATDLPRIEIPARDTAGSAQGPAVVAEPPEAGYARQILVWLAKERSCQVEQHGTDAEDEHLRDSGLEPGGWWDERLRSHLERARTLGLHTRRGRQALGHYVAAAFGLLESAVRVHGELPPPDSPSSDRRDG